MDAGAIGAMIPIVAIVFGIGIAIIGVVTSHKEKVRRHELRHAERLSAMERGLEPPPELTDEKERPRPLLTGMILVGVGAGVFIALEEVAGDGVEKFGLIPGFIGIAYLLYWFFQGRKEGRPKDAA